MIVLLNSIPPFASISTENLLNSLSFTISANQPLSCFLPSDFKPAKCSHLWFLHFWPISILFKLFLFLFSSAPPRVHSSILFSFHLTHLIYFDGFIYHQSVYDSQISVISSRWYIRWIVRKIAIFIMELIFSVLLFL